jgi:hypothetical protein
METRKGKFKKKWKTQHLIQVLDRETIEHEIEVILKGQKKIKQCTCVCEFAHNHILRYTTVNFCNNRDN